VLLSAGEDSQIIANRLRLLRRARRELSGEAPAALPEAPQLDTWLSAWKVERREPPPEAGPIFEAYAELLRARQAVAFDDLVVRAGELLNGQPRVRSAWQARFTHLCVDEFQDVDAAQLRLVRILAAPEDNLFVVGDDDQPSFTSHPHS
jgi:superfamily I DNA/RNA helicase